MKNELSNKELISRIRKHEASTKELLDDIEKNANMNGQEERSFLSLAKLNAGKTLDALLRAVKPA